MLGRSSMEGREAMERKDGDLNTGDALNDGDFCPSSISGSFIVVLVGVELISQQFNTSKRVSIRTGKKTQQSRQQHTSGFFVCFCV